MSKDSGSILRMLFVLASAFFMSHAALSAQPKSIGATFSFTGFAVSYEHELSGRNSFVEASVKAETSEMFL